MIEQMTNAMFLESLQELERKIRNLKQYPRLGIGESRLLIQLDKINLSLYKIVDGILTTENNKWAVRVLEIDFSPIDELLLVCKTETPEKGNNDGKLFGVKPHPVKTKVVAIKKELEKLKWLEPEIKPKQKGGRRSKPFTDYLLGDEETKINTLDKLHTYIDGKTGKAVCLILWGAIEARKMLKPTYNTVANCFGDIGTQQNFDRYMKCNVELSKSGGEKMYVPPFDNEEIERAKQIFME